MSRARRFLFHLAWILPAALVIGGGIAACQRLDDLMKCPNGSGRPLDPRAYPAQRQELCDETNSATDTYDHMLHYFNIALPPAASYVRYLTLNPWNGPDHLFLRFSGDQMDVDQFLAGLHAVPDDRSAADEADFGEGLLSEYHLDDWQFLKPASDYLVYTFGSHTASTAAEGWVIVDRSAAVRTVFIDSAV